MAEDWEPQQKSEPHEAPEPRIADPCPSEWQYRLGGRSSSKDKSPLLFVRVWMIFGIVGRVAYLSCR